MTPTDLNLFFVQGLLQPENPRGWELFKKRHTNYRHCAAFPEEGRLRAREYRLENPEKVKAAQKVFRLENKEERHKANRAWQRANRDKINARARARRANNEQERLARSLRARVSSALQGRAKSAPTLKLLGMDLAEYRIYLQGQFRPGMTWENQGSVWEIDHIKPCASFDFSDLAQQEECFNWSNTQPLFRDENRRKGAHVSNS